MESTKRGIDRIVNAGAFPTVCIFRPTIGSELENEPPPDPEAMKEVFAYLYEACCRARLPIGVLPIEVSLVVQPEEGAELVPKSASTRLFELQMSLMHVLAKPYIAWKMRHGRCIVPPDRIRFLRIVLISVLAAACQSLHRPAVIPVTETVLGKTVRVLVDHFDRSFGEFDLYYELGAPFDPRKPTVLFVTDGQQFHVRQGRLRQIQDELFGPSFNVLGIVSRGSTAAIQQRLLEGQAADWELAYRLLRSDQWVEDIDAVRRDLLGVDGKILLYGRSGGAMLLHEYLGTYGRHVIRAFSQSAPLPALEAEFGLSTDRFWEEIGREDPTLQRELLEVLVANPQDRPEIVQVLQRQNFFVPRSQLAEERARLIRELKSGRRNLYTQLRDEYQVDAVRQMLETPQGIAVRVRLYEFYQPVAAQEQADQAVHPDRENSLNIAQPLLRLQEQGKIPAPRMELGTLHDVPTEVFLLVGRHDHTADYRAQIALASHYRHCRLLLLDDDHVFHRLTESGRYAELVRAVLQNGYYSPAAEAVIHSLKPLRYTEN